MHMCMHMFTPVGIIRAPSRKEQESNSHELDTPALRGVNNSGGSTQRMFDSPWQFLTGPPPRGMATYLMVAEIVEKDLQR